MIDKSNKGVLAEEAGRAEAINNRDGAFAFEEAMKIIDFFADYFDVPYALYKSSILLLFVF